MKVNTHSAFDLHAGYVGGSVHFEISSQLVDGLVWVLGSALASGFLFTGRSLGLFTRLGFGVILKSADIGTMLVHLVFFTMLAGI